jgi:hypothetical protein
MEKLTTKRLLAYKNSLLTCVDEPDVDSYDGFYSTRPNKKDPRWQETYATAKSILATREHIP